MTGREGGQGRRCNFLCRPHYLLGAWAGSATPAEGHQGSRERESKLLGDLQEAWAWHGRAAQSPLSHCLSADMSRTRNRKNSSSRKGSWTFWYFSL